MNVLVCGHSHAIALRRAVNGLSAEWARRGLTYEVEPIGSLTAIDATDAYWEWVLTRIPGKLVVVSWFGNEHNTRFLLEPDRPIFVDHPALPDSVAPRPGEFVVPHETARQLLGAGLGHLRRMLGKIQNRKPAHLFLTAPPPPLPDGEGLRSRLAAQPFFPKLAADLGRDLRTMPITRDATRIALWNVVSDLRREVASELGATWVPAPADVFAPDGTLAEDYWAEDATHASSRYGAALWREIFATIDAREGRTR